MPLIYAISLQVKLNKFENNQKVVNDLSLESLRALVLSHLNSEDEDYSKLFLLLLANLGINKEIIDNIDSLCPINKESEKGQSVDNCQAKISEIEANYKDKLSQLEVTTNDQAVPNSPEKKDKSIRIDNRQTLLKLYENSKVLTSPLETMTINQKFSVTKNSENMGPPFPDNISLYFQIYDEKKFIKADIDLALIAMNGRPPLVLRTKGANQHIIHIVNDEYKNFEKEYIALEIANYVIFFNLDIANNKKSINLESGKIFEMSKDRTRLLASESLIPN